MGQGTRHVHPKVNDGAKHSGFCWSDIREAAFRESSQDSRASSDGASSSAEAALVEHARLQREVLVRQLRQAAAHCAASAARHMERVALARCRALAKENLRSLEVLRAARRQLQEPEAKPRLHSLESLPTSSTASTATSTPRD